MENKKACWIAQR